MLPKTLLEVLAHPADGEVAIVTQGSDGPHVVNTWNSCVQVMEDDRLLIPAGRMNKTEENVRADSRVKLTIGSREVQGLNYKGTGFLITGTARFVEEGPELDTVKGKFPWARAALEVRVEASTQTL